MSIFDKTNKGYENGSFSISGKKIICPFCGHDFFEVKSVLMNTPGLTFFGLDWANRSAFAVICTKCGKIEWFQHSPEPS
ncbi:MAG: DNA-binding protein [Ignavibacteriae bacterium HGW-Ignavibacteriae-3]|nr:MAG: DNA-binding protein [Ignavibacteriae bacterium HGW-Ignavibacteriae-3]